MEPFPGLRRMNRSCATASRQSEETALIEGALGWPGPCALASAADDGDMKSGPRLTDLLLACGAAAGPLFVAVFTVEGARREGYDPVREPVSALALGDRGWTQRFNFVGTGALMLAYSGGLRRAMPRARWAPRLVAAFAVGLVGAGVFVTDPVTGSPAVEPGPVAPNVQGALHNAFSMVVFGALAGACGAVASRFARTGHAAWAGYSALSGLLVVSGVGLFGRAFGNARGLADVGGAIQRLTILIGWSWLSMLALRLLRGSGPD